MLLPQKSSNRSEAMNSPLFPDRSLACMGHYLRARAAITPHCADCAPLQKSRACRFVISFSDSAVVSGGSYAAFHFLTSSIMLSLTRCAGTQGTARSASYHKCDHPEDVK